MADLDVKCEQCGTILTAEFVMSRGVFLEVDPCEKCLEEAKDKGIKEGQEEEQ